MADIFAPPQLKPGELPGPATRTLALGASQNQDTPIGSSVTGGLIPAAADQALGGGPTPPTPVPSPISTPPTGGLSPGLPAPPTPPTGGLAPPQFAFSQTGGLSPGLPQQAAPTTPELQGGPIVAPPPPIPTPELQGGPIVAPPEGQPPAPLPELQGGPTHFVPQPGFENFPQEVQGNTALQGLDPAQVQVMLGMQQNDLNAAREAEARGPLHPGDVTGKDPVGFMKAYNTRIKQGMSEEQAVAGANQQIEVWHPGNQTYLSKLEADYANGGTAEYINRILTQSPHFFGENPRSHGSSSTTGTTGGPGEVIVDPPPITPPVFPPDPVDEVGREILGEGGPAFPQFELDRSETDPFSDLIDQRLADLGSGVGSEPGLGEGLGQAGDQGVQTLADLTRTGGTNPQILKDARRNLEEQLVGARKAGSNDLLNSLAGRGLSGGGSAVQGLTNLEEGLRAEQGQRLRDLSIAEQLAAQDRSLNAASTLGQQDLQAQQLNLTAEQQGISNSLSALSEATGRALGIGNLGLENMGQNLDFIEAMRRLNLDEASFIEATTQARQGNVNNALGMLMNLFNMLQQGFV